MKPPEELRRVGTLLQLRAALTHIRLALHHFQAADVDVGDEDLIELGRGSLASLARQTERSAELLEGSLDPAELHAADAIAGIAVVLQATGAVRCETEGCVRAAIVVAHWPGRSLRLCQICRARAHQIAEAMGFLLQTSPIEPDEPEPHGRRRG